MLVLERHAISGAVEPSNSQRRANDSSADYTVYELSMFIENRALNVDKSYDMTSTYTDIFKTYCNII